MALQISAVLFCDKSVACRASSSVLCRFDPDAATNATRADGGATLPPAGARPIRRAGEAPRYRFWKNESRSFRNAMNASHGSPSTRIPSMPHSGSTKKAVIWLANAIAAGRCPALTAA